MIFQKSLVMMFCFALTGICYSQSKKIPVKTNTAKKTAATRQPSPAKSASASTGVDNTLLFEISGKGLSAPSYLFGTMHILCAEDAQLSPNLKEIIRKSGQVYFEIDLDNMQELFGAVSFLAMAGGKQLSDLVTTDEYNRVKNYFDKNKSMLPFNMMTHFKPYFITSLIGEQMMSCEKKNGMESLIMEVSRKYGKEIKGLETSAFQASIFDSIPYEKQAKDLVEYIDSVDKYRKNTEELVRVYKEQDLGQLNTLMHKSEPGLEQYMDLLLYDRNRKWAKQMPAVMSELSTLFAVGAGHLPGDEGVISLLKRQGYTVKPVKNK